MSQNLRVERRLITCLQGSLWDSVRTASRELSAGRSMTGRVHQSLTGNHSQEVADQATFNFLSFGGWGYLVPPGPGALEYLVVQPLGVPSTTTLFSVLRGSEVPCISRSDLWESCCGLQKWHEVYTREDHSDKSSSQ